MNRRLVQLKNDDSIHELQDDFKAQFFVFKGTNFISCTDLNQKRISVGSGSDTDLHLDADKIAPIQVYFYFDNDMIVLSNETPGKLVFVNGAAINTSIITLNDKIEIGPYTIKIKIEGFESPETNEADSHVKQKEKGGVRQLFRKSGSDESRKSKGTWDKLTTKFRVTQEKQEPAAEEEMVSETSGPALPLEKSFQVIDNRYNVVFSKIIRDGFTLDEVKSNMAALFKADSRKINQLFSKPFVVIKHNLTIESGAKFKDNFEKTGAMCDLELIDDAFELTPDPQVLKKKSEKENKNRLRKEREKKNTEEALTENSFQDQPIEITDDTDLSDLYVNTESSENFDPNLRQTLVVDKNSLDTLQKPIMTGEEEDDDDDDEYEDDIEASFSLKEKIISSSLIKSNKTALRAGFQDVSLEIIKFSRDRVIDHIFLNKGEKYNQFNDTGKYCIADFNRSGKRFYYFNSNIKQVIKSDNTGTQVLEDLKIKENLYRKRKEIYRDTISPKQQIRLHDGCYEYLIRESVNAASPVVKMPEKSNKKDLKFFLISLGIHAALVLSLLIQSFVASQEDINIEPIFATIDSVELEKIIKKRTPPPKPKPKPPVKKEPVVVKPAEKKPVKKIVKKKPAKSVVISKKKVKNNKKSKQVARKSSDPNAGGGFGKGNVVNRDVNQVGLLSMLGNNTGAVSSSAALASVTNLDAVSSPGAGKNNFKVGGIVGKLGTSKISMPTSGIISTQGSNQVLRSAGASGKGRVAAMEKGKTGQKAVQGTVSAQMTKSVRIQGGMSRAAVKKVIDQHLDEINYCYETALISNPSILGKVTFEWKILMSGRVGEIRIKSSSLNSHELHACIKSSIKSWQFPKPTGAEVIVSYPFVFDIVGF